MRESASFGGPGPPRALTTLAARARRGTAILAATSAAAAPLAANLAPATRHQSQSPPLSCPPPLASITAGSGPGSGPGASPTSGWGPGLGPGPGYLLELLGPSLRDLGGQWVTHLLSQAQRFVDGYLAELHAGGCPATAGVLRAHWYAAGVQVATLGLITPLLTLDRAAVLRGQVWRLVTGGLVHAGPLHFLLNYLAIAKLGPQLERVAGTQRFTAVYCASAAAAAVASLALSGGRPSLGSSGAVFGLAAALWRYHAAHVGVLPPEADAELRRVGDRVLQVTLLQHVLLWSRLDIGGHLGGALAGWFAAKFLGPEYKLGQAPAGRGPFGGWSPLPLPLSLPWGSGGGAGRGPVFWDRPPVATYADAKPRDSIPFPALGMAYSVPAVTAAVTAQPPPPPQQQQQQQQQQQRR